MPKRSCIARTAADHPVELEPPRQVPFHREDAAPAVDLLAHARQQLIEPAEVERLAQVVHRPELDRLDRGVDRRVARHEHGLAVRVDVADGAQDVEAADLRHPQVDHHQVRPARLDQRDRRAAVGTGRHVEAGALARSAIRRRGCPARRRRSPAVVVDSSCAPHTVEDHGRQRRPQRRATGTAARAPRSPARVRTARPRPRRRPSTSRRWAPGRRTGAARRRHAVEIGREDPAVDEGDAQAAAPIARQGLVGAIGRA